MRSEGSLPLPASKFVDPVAAEHALAPQSTHERKILLVQAIFAVVQLCRSLRDVQQFIRRRWCRCCRGQAQPRNLSCFLNLSKKVRQFCRLQLVC
jgi:hypothetical protein